MKLIRFSVLATLWISSCTGPENNPLRSGTKPPENSFATMSSVKGAWQLRSKFTWTKTRKNWQKGRNEVQSLPPCDRDDVELFRTDGQWRMEEGLTTCQLLDPLQLAHGQWWASGRDSLWVMYNDGELIRYRINRLTDSTMIRLWSLNRSGEQLVVEEQMTRIH